MTASFGSPQQREAARAVPVGAPFSAARDAGAAFGRRGAGAAPQGRVNHACLASFHVDGRERPRGEPEAMPLKLSLKPGERFVLNGAVVQNGDRRSTLVLQNKASVLREKDIMQAEEVNSPSRRVYFPVMMMYLDEAAAGRYYDEFARRMGEFMGVLSNPDILAECVGVSKHVMGREYYKALMGCRKLIEYEDERLGNVASGVPASRAAG
jgi:flagellar protein FlbT